MLLVLVTACSAFPTLTNSSSGTLVWESFYNFLLPMSPSIHVVCPTRLLGLGLIQNLMIIRWSGFSAYYCVVLPSLESLDWRLMFTHSPQVNGECVVPPIWGILRRERPAFANGALHWIGLRNDNKRFVLVFDLGDEVFRQILLPELPSYTGRMVWTRVSVYGNSIAGFQRTVGSGQINIWVMKEYGVASSWTKFSH